MRIAVIDIGTVTTRLLIADATAEPAQEGSKSSAHKTSHTVIGELYRGMTITHLGQDITKTGALSEAGIERVATAIAGFNEKIKEFSAEKVICIATSASRDASNGYKLTEALAQEGITPHIIAGESEAALSFRGAMYGEAGEHIMVADVGGGSTELILGSPDGTIECSQSLNIGSRRLTEMFIKSDPPTLDELAAVRGYIAEKVAEFFSVCKTTPEKILAVAGTATTLVAIKYALAKYDREFVHGKPVSREEVKAIAEMLGSKTIAERKKVVGLEPERAAVSVPGGLILEEILVQSNLAELIVCENDILHGVLLDTFENGGLLGA